MASIDSLAAGGGTKNAASAKKVACIANRDLELMDAIKHLMEVHFNVECLSYLADGAFPESLFTAEIWHQNVAIILPKFLTDHKRNPRLYTAIEASGVPTLNSLFSLRLCENRKLTFMFLERNFPYIRIPKFYLTEEKCLRAIQKGRKIIIKRNTHHVPHRFRCLGVAENPQDLRDMTSGVPKEDVFFQEFFGPCGNAIYKVYFIGGTLMSLKCVKEDIFAERNKSDVQERIESPLALTEGFRQIGEVLKMNVFGLDYVIAPDYKPYLVDVNDFPSFKGIPEAPGILCEFIFNHFLSL